MVKITLDLIMKGLAVYFVSFVIVFFVFMMVFQPIMKDIYAKGYNKGYQVGKSENPLSNLHIAYDDQYATGRLPNISTNYSFNVS
jgi:hypothetical protein